MKIKALITTLAILGTSSVAMARPVFTASAEASWTFGTNPAPVVVRDHGYDRPVIVRDHGYDRPVIVRDHRDMRPTRATIIDARLYQHDLYRPRLVLLAQGLAFSSYESRKFIKPDQSMAFSQIRIEAAGGRTYLKQVLVEFVGGGYQKLTNIDMMLAGNQAFTIDLDGNRRQIKRIVVYGGDAHLNGRQGYWMRTNGAFNVTAL